MVGEKCDADANNAGDGGRCLRSAESYPINAKV